MVSNLVLRVASALILAPVVIGCIYYDAIPLYKCLLAVMATVLAWEWELMLSKKTSSVALIIATTAVMTVFLTAENPQLALAAILVGTGLVYWKSKAASLAFGTLYIGLPMAALTYMYYINENNSKEIVLWLFFVVWATDIGGYVVGKSVGGPKIMPKISPKKTWAGLIGGVGFAAGVAYVFALYLKAYERIDAASFNQVCAVLVISAGILAVISQAGDFFESYIKRKLDLKDASNLIPGHGGLFDRVDGLLFAAVFAALGLVVVNQWWM